MGKKIISRKKFLSTAFTGFAGTKLMSKNIMGNQTGTLERRNVGKFMNFHEINNKECFYDVIMTPFNPTSSYTHSITGIYKGWDQNRLISILHEAENKGIGVITMKTCSGGKYLPTPDDEPSYQAAVIWVIQHSFVSSVAVAMVNFEQVNDYIPLLNNL
jgi:predicted aldo/keto reductase-like oxidoreductase